MFGHQHLSEQREEFLKETWNYDIIAETDGVLAVFPFGDLKTEVRVKPRGTCKLMELAANYAYETTHYNLLGVKAN